VLILSRQRAGPAADGSSPVVAPAGASPAEGRTGRSPV